MLAATVMGGLRFNKMMHSALAIFFISFVFIDPRPVTLHAVFEKTVQHSELVSERCS